MSEQVNLIVVSLPAAVMFFVVAYFSGVLQSGLLDYSTNVGSPLANWTGFSSYSVNVDKWSGFLSLLLLTHTTLSADKSQAIWKSSAAVWLLFSLILLLLPIASVSPFRWVLMLTYPFAFYATETLSSAQINQVEALPIYSPQNCHSLSCAVNCHSEFWFHVC